MSSNSDVHTSASAHGVSHILILTFIPHAHPGRYMSPTCTVRAYKCIYCTRIQIHILHAHTNTCIARIHSSPTPRFRRESEGGNSGRRGWVWGWGGEGAAGVSLSLIICVCVYIYIYIYIHTHTHTHTHTR